MKEMRVVVDDVGLTGARLMGWELDNGHPVTLVIEDDEETRRAALTAGTWFTVEWDGPRIYFLPNPDWPVS